MIKYEDDRVVDWIWKLCNMVFKSVAVPGDCRPAVMVPLYKAERDRTECTNYRVITLLSVVGKIYAGI